ncbi:MAG: hypothetical protein K8R02_08325 [Anaerohalosphaeraceae bacterium]|nr:hypothetical protein [Anaerohalosphaeraceae bacterium]
MTKKIMNVNERKNIMVTCGPGLKDYLIAELAELGFDEIISSRDGGVVTRGTFVDCMKMNYCLRTAYNVFYLLREFRCGSTEALYKQVSMVDWENIIDPAEHLCVIGKVDTWTVDNSMFPNMKVKDAIVDRISKKKGTRPNSGKERDGVVVNLFWKQHNAWIYLNTSGEKISDRNYRKMPHKAPLRETLAAGIIAGSGYDGSCDLVLPMCGSGTLAIEAALIAMNRPAGALRTNFGFQHIKGYDESVWQEIRNDFRKKIIKNGVQKRIIATDIDEQAIEAAKQNAKTAGVEHLIEFSVCDFEETEIPSGEGIVIMNPEYGQRMGEIEQLEKDYERIGAFLKKKCTGYNGYIFSGNKELVAKIGLKASRRMIFFNGKIECRLYKYEMYGGTRRKMFAENTEKS